MKVSYAQVNGFSHEEAGGNPAGVVLDKNLSQEQKQTVATELGFAETVFINEAGPDCLHLEYFTPTEEVDICGHATIASLGYLKSIGKLPETEEIKIKTRAGIQKIFFQNGFVFMTQADPEFGEQFDQEAIARLLNIPPEKITNTPEVVSTGLKDCLVEVTDIDELKALSPDLSAMSEFSKKNGLVGFHVFTRPSLEKGNTAFARNFAPACGIDEESATGTSNLALASWLQREKFDSDTMTFEQGDFMNAASRIYVKKIKNTLCVGGNFYLIKNSTVNI